jgi:hypothetical protein
MARVLRLQVPSEVDDGPEPDASPLRTPVAGPHPLEHRPRADHGVSRGRRDASEVAQDPLVIVQLKAGRPATGEVGIDRGVQHGTTSGQGWATVEEDERAVHRRTPRAEVVEDGIADVLR